MQRKPTENKIIVCHIITGLATGGAERSLFNLILGSDRAHYEHRVVSLTGMGTYGAPLKKLGVRVTALGLKQRPWCLVSLGFMRDIRAAQIVQGWMYHGNIAAWMATRFSTCKLSWNVRHSLDDFQGEGWSTKWAIRLNAILSKSADAIVYNSQKSQKQHQNFGISHTMGRFIPNGFDTEIYKPDTQARIKARRELNISDAEKVVCHIGRFHPVKDHESFLEAALLILNENANISVIMSGRGVDYENHFFDRRVPGNLRQRVHLLGDRDDVSHLMAASDIFVQTSISEGFPNVLGEAMATGLACIATDAGDSTYVMRDGGVCIAVGDVYGLKEKMEVLLSDATLRNDLGCRARSRIVDDFPIHSTNQHYDVLYKYLMRQE